MTIKINNQEILPWHKNAWNLLGEYIHSNRIPQALLITGHKGLGKFFLAKQFSQALVCQHRQANGMACFNCSACRLVVAETHPDFITITPQEIGKAISINQVRDLLNQLSLAPQYEYYRVVIISSSEQMTQASANALLKCLEEPPKRTVMILVAESKALLPATIVSRCQSLALTIPEYKVSQQWLQSQKITDNTEAIINMGSGTPLLAYRYANQDLLKQRQDCFNQWIGLVEHAEDKVSPVQIAEQWYKLESDQVLTWLMSWLMDIIKIQSTQGSWQLTNSDLSKPLQACAQRLELQQLFQFYDLLCNSLQRLQTQLNKQLIYEQLLLEWATYNRSKLNYAS